MPEPAQIFFSYKSQNANVARIVAEGLIANAVPVWFAEFEVLIYNYDEFQQAIDVGIDNCRYALLFTNTDWAKSKYCQFEIVRLMQRLPAERILRVEIPSAEEPEQLMNWLRREILQHPPCKSLTKQSPNWIDDAVRQVEVPRNAWPAAFESELQRSPAILWQNRLEDVLAFVRQHTGRLPECFLVPRVRTDE